MTYKIEDLQHRGDSEAENIRTREMFLDLKSKALKGDELTEHEKEWFCLGVRLSNLNDGKEEDYPCCENPIFKRKYLYYWQNLTGGSLYQKAENGAIYDIPITEAQKDLAFLIEEAKEWLVEIQKTNHSSDLMQQTSKETREQKKGLDNSPQIKNDIFIKGSFFYRYKLWSLLLVSKFVYLTCLEIIETFNKFPYQLNINGKIIEFTEYSLVHIIMRHYAELTKKFETGKSFHNTDFLPKQLALNLELIFDKIQITTSIENEGNIIFEFNNQLYEIWINERNKSVKGKGVVKFLRLETFYPLEDASKKEEILSSYKEIEIEENLRFFKK